MSIWIDQCTLFCDTCDNHKVVGVNLEKWALDDFETPAGWETRNSGTEEIILCPKCVDNGFDGHHVLEVRRELEMAEIAHG